MNKIGYILLIIAFASCQRQDYDFERTRITINNQKFEIITAWKIFDEYIEHKSNYENNIFFKIEEEFDNDNSEFPFLLDAIKSKINPDEAFKKEIELMKSINFVSIVDSIFQTVTKELPGPDTKILFIPANPANRKFYREYGVGIHAFTLGAGKIIVSFDPEFRNWQQLLPYTLAHEYHHSVWISRNFETADITPLEYIVLEGKADSFAGDIFPNIIHPFINMLDENNENRIWDLIKPEMNQRNSNINDMIFYGSKEIPYGSVYAIGYNILKLFKENNPEFTDLEIMDIPPEKILQLSKYDE